VPAPQSAPRSGSPRPRAGGRHGWWTQAATGLGVSVLGLALAGSLATPTHAAPLAPGAGPTRAPLSAPRPGASSTPTTDPSVLAPYAPAAGDVPGPALAAALVAERAAQRDEELAKAAAAVSRSARTAKGQARQQQLDADGKATSSEGERLAREALARAVAARVAAEQARREAEAAQQAATAAAAGGAATGGAATGGATGTTSAPAPAPTAPVVAEGKGVSPVPGAVVGARFGDRGLWATYHTGLDFRASYGTAIRAVESGTVLFAGNSGDWSGNHVAIRHPDGMTTMSSHMSSMAVHAGQTVQAGQVIGYVGQTGRAFGPHLHFELYPVGVRYGDVYHAVDPVPWLRANGVITR